MTKKAIIEISLVKESNNKTNKELEKEIREGLAENIQAIPWAAKTEKITIKNT